MNRLKIIALHEAAHATLAYRVGGYIPSKGTVEASETQGHTEYSTLFLSTGEKAVVSLGGQIAEELYLGHATGGNHEDDAHVVALAREFNDESRAVESWVRGTIKLLEEPLVKSSVLTLADALEARGTMGRDDVEAILRPAMRVWNGEPDPWAGKKIRIVRSKGTRDGRATMPTDEGKTFQTIRNAAGQIVDYRDVKFAGYLSTFKATTEADRDGDYVEPGAFAESIPAFMKNPVLLCDHRNDTACLAGSFTLVKEDARGLYVEALISNAPDLVAIRAAVAEGHLRTLSMGGRFHYKEDGRGIWKVDLYEGSLTPIPSNPDAIFSVN